MTLNEILLEKLNEWRPDNVRTPLALTTPDCTRSLSLIADQNERLACQVWELTLTRQDAPVDLKAWAARTCDQVTGLLEPLQVIEVDAERKIAQIRSDSPARRGEKVAYYEILLTGTKETVVRRYEAAEKGGRKREQIGFALTHEALAKLVADLILA